MADTDPAPAPVTHSELPLFPLQTVLFPDGLLPLRVFETRYLDMVAGCMRAQRPFGVVGLQAGSEVRQPDGGVVLRPVGTFAELIDVDSTQPGILEIRCRGTRCFSIVSSRQQPDGLWLAEAVEWPPEPAVEPDPAHRTAVDSLREAVQELGPTGGLEFLPPHRFDDAGWVANRWAEVLPLSLDARQLLLELQDPHARLGLIDSLLRAQAVRSRQRGSA